MLGVRACVRACVLLWTTHSLGCGRWDVFKVFFVRCRTRWMVVAPLRLPALFRRSARALLCRPRSSPRTGRRARAMSSAADEASAPCTVGEPCLPTVAAGVVGTDLPVRFQQDGFVVFDQVLREGVADALTNRLDAILRGSYDLSTPPDKAPPTPRVAAHQSKKTLQVINVRKCDSLFRAVITSPVLGQMVAELGGWEGAKVASDQIWCKPPTAGPLAHHRDSAYFDFVPADVITLWLALDDMDEELGPLEYAKGSHLWGEGRIGSANQFFDKDRYRLMHSAAAAEGIAPGQIEMFMVRVRRGGAGVHNGRTWHGSGPNRSTRLPRRGLGVHFVPSNAVFKEGELGKMWRMHRQEGTNVMPSSEFPTTWSRPPSRSTTDPDTVHM